MSHVIVMRARSCITASTMLLQAAIVLRLHKREPRWIELHASEDSTSATLRIGMQADAVTLAPLVEQLRSLPECSEVLLEIPPATPPEITTHPATD